MRIEYPQRHELRKTLAGKESDALDFIVLATSALEIEPPADCKDLLAECVRVLRPGGLLFVQGMPKDLPELGVFLDGKLQFKYWVAVESMRTGTTGLPSVHAGLLLFSKGNARFNIKRVRFPHHTCEFCGRTLRDWGGKAHLMHPEGRAMSDVWTDLPPSDNYSQLSQPVLDTILSMVDSPDQHAVRGLVGPDEGVSGEPPVVPQTERMRLALAFDGPRRAYGRINRLDAELANVIHRGDAIEILKRYPDNSIDLAFADPPYNLNKDYSSYEDGTEDAKYIEWCNSWLKEYARVIKPSGSLYVLNLPRWTMHHAAFLNRHLSFQNWIVWNALSEPRGKLMPAHYGLLFYTKHPTDFTFNYDDVGELDAGYYCLRASCVRKRKEAGADDKERLTDIWSDVHRIKHKKDRDYHPCQLPDALLERIIRLSTNEGDVVLDALCGVGTTPIVAAKLRRCYVGIDIDESYVAITEEKLRCVQERGYVVRRSIKKDQSVFTKKELQLELRSMAVRLGRLPSPDDVRSLSRYDLDAFLSVFPTWGKALKAAKLEVFADARA